MELCIVMAIALLFAVIILMQEQEIKKLTKAKQEEPPWANDKDHAVKAIMTILHEFNFQDRKEILTNVLGARLDRMHLKYKPGAEKY